MRTLHRSFASVLGSVSIALYALTGCTIGCVEGSFDGDDVASDPSGRADGGTPHPSTDPPSESDAGDDGSSVVDDTSPPPVPNDPSGYPQDDGAGDTHQLSAKIAQHISISEVASYQSIKVSLARDGQKVERTRWEKIWGSEAAVVPIVGGREAMLRVFVKPEDGFTPSKITARVKLQVKGTTKIFYGTNDVSAASTDGDLGSTINVTVPADAMVPGTKIGVVLNGPGDAPAPNGDSTARYPKDGSLDDFGVEAGGDVMKVVLVPMRYNGDGSGRMPDTSDQQVAMYKDHFFRRYPVARVEVTVHAPIDYNAVIPKGDGMGDLLNTVSDLRDKEKGASNVYYVGLLQPAAKFWDYCGSGCVAGLSWVGEPASVWWGYSGTDWAGSTGAHELGHAHGLPHAPCGTTDPDFWPGDADHDGAKLGAWGWDPVEKKLFDPGGDANPSAKGTQRDVMSYCGPTWIGDFNYAKLWRRIKTDNGVTSASIIGTPPQMESVHVAPDGTLKWSATQLTYQQWMDDGEPRSVTVTNADGTTSTQTGYYFPYDHLPGGHLVFPAQPKAQAVHFGGKTMTLRL